MSPQFCLFVLLRSIVLPTLISTPEEMHGYSQSQSRSNSEKHKSDAHSTDFPLQILDLFASYDDDDDCLLLILDSAIFLSRADSLRSHVILHE